MMRVADSGRVVQKGGMLIRILLLTNFVLLLLLIGPGRSHKLDLLLRRLGLEDVIGRSLQIWIVGSTILATVVFGGMAWKRMRAKSSGAPMLQTKFEGVLLMAWWITLLGFLAYGFMLGMGG